ncbi:MAG TPA: hypothetical protein P5556_09650 [Candidatus Gastranaerophilales bacterium]|nr:hypothetical protein [Candidatus Gastranaerophilales bacterium]
MNISISSFSPLSLMLQPELKNNNIDINNKELDLFNLFNFNSLNKERDQSVLEEKPLNNIALEDALIVSVLIKLFSDILKDAQADKKTNTAEKTSDQANPLTSASLENPLSVEETKKGTQLSSSPYLAENLEDIEGGCGNIYHDMAMIEKIKNETGIDFMCPHGADTLDHPVDMRKRSLEIIAGYQKQIDINQKIIDELSSKPSLTNEESELLTIKQQNLNEYKACKEKEEKYLAKINKISYEESLNIAKTMWDDYKKD